MKDERRNETYVHSNTMLDDDLKKELWIEDKMQKLQK